MARIRTIKPELWENEQLARLPMAARLLFIGLVSHADDEGRERAGGSLVRCKVFPHDEDISGAEVEGWMRDLEGIGMIELYTLGGTKYLQVTNFCKHQRISHPTPSTHPSADAPQALRTSSGTSASGRDQGREGIKEGNRESRTAGSDTLTGEVVERPEVLDLCNLLADTIASDGTKRPTISKDWQDECRRLIDLDGATVEQVRYVIGWAHRPGNFWASNILSTRKLREKWSTLTKEIRRTASVGSVDRLREWASDAA